MPRPCVRANLVDAPPLAHPPIMRLKASRNIGCSKYRIPIGATLTILLDPPRLTIQARIRVVPVVAKDHNRPNEWIGGWSSFDWFGSRL
ncbi:hypothetical protein Poly59_10340 [Rubripirellula reticaptiva]|uniref:Uncharacterized protein n=1 Tax=Rubripirellula reticaptiva TaxID=2528013 RepID=A0A5C6F9M6_9BACT|nr:hypothetical protein Poly59_10340 [Rubripirellula reticaptiva]